MYSDTYVKVQENSDIIWKSQRYTLVIEFVKKPTLPPPLIIISLAYQLSKYIMNTYIYRIDSANSTGKLSTTKITLSVIFIVLNCCYTNLRYLILRLSLGSIEISRKSINIAKVEAWMNWISFSYWRNYDAREKPKITENVFEDEMEFV